MKRKYVIIKQLLKELKEYNEYNEYNNLFYAIFISLFLFFNYRVLL